MSDDVIDLLEYARRREEAESDRTVFAVWGGEGERSRFALPLWRAIFLAGGDRGGLVWTAPGTPLPQPFVVLDLACDPARTEYEALPPEDEDEPPVPPSIRDDEGRVVVHLGEHRERRWYMVLDGMDANEEPLERRVREDIVFLSGECAGLLFYRDFAADVDGADAGGPDVDAPDAGSVDVDEMDEGKSPGGVAPPMPDDF